MYVVSLIAEPDSLNPEFVGSIQHDLHGGAIRHLSPGEAAEFNVPRLPSHLEELRKELDEQGVDLNVVSSQHRERRALLADMDSTMIEQECIDELAAEAGFGAQVAAITARAMNGEIDFDAALTERVALLRDLPLAVIREVLDSRITLAKGAICLVHTMRKHGAHCALVSGGFTDFARVVAERIGFHEYRANQLARHGDLLNGEVIPPILGATAKVETLNEIAKRGGFAPADVIAVGDGANDLGMLHAAGLGVALHAKPAVAAQAKVRVNHGDLTALLFLQGIAREDFVA